MKEGIKLNNKGLTLIELLIALAISSIILAAVALLMSNGMKGYSKQTTTATLQDDANLAMNHITNAIMEANYIDLVRTDAVNTYSFVTNDGSNAAVGSNKYIFDADTETLYVAEKDGDLASASPLCTRVKKFSVQIKQPGSLTTSGSGGANLVTKVNETVQLKVELVLEGNGVSREVTRYTNVRNKLGDTDPTDGTDDTKLLIDGNSIVGLAYDDDLKDKGYIAE